MAQAGSEPTGVLAAARSGDVRRTLEAMRDNLATQMDGAEPAVAAQISGQLRQVLKDLRELPADAEVSKSNELAARREARRIANAKVATAPAKGGRKRG